MHTYKWLSHQLKNPAWLFGFAKLMFFVALVLLAIVVAAQDAPSFARQHWWWNIH